MESSRVQNLIGIPNDETTFFAGLDRVLANCAGGLLAVGQAFRANLVGISALVTIPYRVARLCVGEQKQAEIRKRVQVAMSTAFSQFGTPTGKVDSLNVSLKELLSELSPPGADRQLVRNAIDLAAKTLESSDVKNSVEEILRQALVLTWSALEVLANDLAVELLNRDPQTGVRVLQSPDFKRTTGGLKLGIESLEEYGFNLSTNFGSFIFDRWSITSVEAMRVVFGLIFTGDEAVLRELSSGDLWHLSQKRHLIVHRRGIIDSRYLRSSKGSDLVVGVPLPIALADVNRYQTCVRDLGSALLNAAASRAAG